MGFFGVRVGFKNCFGVSLYRLILFVISVWLYKSYIGSELKSKVSRWTDDQRRSDGYVKIMPLVAPTPQLRLRWTELSWSVEAECGNSFAFRGAYGWSSLPVSLRTVDKTDEFKKELRSYTLLNIPRFVSSI